MDDFWLEWKSEESEGKRVMAQEFVAHLNERAVKIEILIQIKYLVKGRHYFLLKSYSLHTSHSRP